MPKCCHKVDEEGSTLDVVRRRMLVYPPTVQTICRECHKVIEFRKDFDGSYHRIIKRASAEKEAKPDTNNDTE